MENREFSAGIGHKNRSAFHALQVGRQLSSAKNDKKNRFFKNKASKTRATLPNQFSRRLDTWTRITKKFLSESDCWKLVINSPEVEDFFQIFRKIGKSLSNLHLN